MPAAWAMGGLEIVCAMSGTEVACAVSGTELARAMSGTEMAYMHRLRWMLKARPWSYGPYTTTPYTPLPLPSRTLPFSLPLPLPFSPFLLAESVCRAADSGEGEARLRVLV
eukprot:2119999-Rhodomonas_salina.2